MQLGAYSGTVDPFPILFGGLVLFFLLFVLALGAWHPKSARSIVGRSLRSDEAETEIEAGDIEQMLDARDERRRRAGQPSLADELADQVKREPRDG
jgi:hypothetical protein